MGDLNMHDPELLYSIYVMLKSCLCKKIIFQILVDSTNSKGGWRIRLEVRSPSSNVIIIKRKTMFLLSINSTLSQKTKNI